MVKTYPIWQEVIIYGEEVYTKETKGEDDYEIMRWLNQHKKLAKKRKVFYDIEPLPLIHY